MFKSSKFSVFLLFSMLLILAACGNGEETSAESDDQADETRPATVTISAAASLTDAIQEVGELFNEENPDIQLDFNFGGSGALQQQISQGAPADIFFSASQSDFDTLVDEGAIDQENSSQLLKNELVLVVPEDKTRVTSFDNLTSAENIAVGTPESVPAGEYAMETFDSMNLTQDLEDKLIYAEDVRAVLTYVERGEVDAGLVYRTDAMTSDKIEIVDATKEDTHTPIEYPVGLINDSENQEAAQAFYEFLQTEEALKVFEDYGFVTE